MREKAGQGSYVLCDFWRCSRRFATVSDSSVVRAQAEQCGWAFVSGKLIRDEKGQALSSKKVDLCPDHRPKATVVR